ncbi:amino acid transporter [Thermogymnomonas acidicola]|uniref:Amino acid transporter n=1 Tax=Thermogymnomonas acidicola TaxID=399579 RepID=A0AA37BQY0_9ARCH|nr:APC family permease [Thermogymnomonas acidicola]GGM71780.1 amino acid transporter [Thermogymnomonas acidicola]
MADNAETYSGENYHRLKRGQVGFWGAVAEEIAAMAPACDTVAFVTSAAAFAFMLTPLAFLIAMLTMFLEVNTLYHLSKRHASAGGYYGYISTAFGPRPAIVSGLLYVLYQIASTAAIPVYVAGVVLPGVIYYFFHVALPAWIWIPFILVFIVVPIVLAIVGIRPQMKYVRVAAFFEIAFLGVLSLIIILRAPDNTAAVFNPFAWKQYSSLFANEGGPVAGLGLGMIFGLTSFIGYGGSAPLGEEVDHPRSVTKALIYGLVLVGIILTEVAYALTVGWGTSMMQSFAQSNIPGIIVATLYTGIAGGFMLALVAFNSAFSDSVAMQSNAGRVYFAMARDGIIPKFFSEVSERFATPWKSLAFIGTVSSAVAVGATFTISAAMGLSPVELLSGSANSAAISSALSNTFQLLTTVALVGLILTHTLLNTSVMTMFRRLRERHITLGQKILHPIEHYIMPAVATAIFIFVLYESIVPPIFPVTQAVLISSVYLVLAVLYVVVLSKKRPETVKRAGRLVNMVEEESGGID